MLVGNIIIINTMIFISLVIHFPNTTLYLFTLIKNIVSFLPTLNGLILFFKKNTRLLYTRQDSADNNLRSFPQ